MLADHLGSGDYAITRAVFAGVLMLGVGAAAFSIVVARSWARALGLAVALILTVAAVRVHSRWEQVTDAVDRMTGPAGGEFRLSELDDVAREVLGGGFVLLVMWMLVVMLIAVVVQGRRHPTVAKPASIQS